MVVFTHTFWSGNFSPNFLLTVGGKIRSQWNKPWQFWILRCSLGNTFSHMFMGMSQRHLILGTWFGIKAVWFKGRKNTQCPKYTFKILVLFIYFHSVFSRPLNLNYILIVTESHYIFQIFRKSNITIWFTINSR